MLSEWLSSFQNLPDKRTLVGLVITVLITAIITHMIRNLVNDLWEKMKRPFCFLIDKIYAIIAPRFPRFSLRRYKTAILRSDLARLENPVGPSEIHISLEKAFAPIRVISDGESEPDELTDLAKKHRRFMILGGPGSGKTTLMKHMIINILSGHHADMAALGGAIPVFITLRTMAEDKHNVEQAICKAFEQYSFPAADKFVEASLELGRLIIILDGLDEVGQERSEIAQRINAFCKADDRRSRFNRVYVTCRETSYRVKDLNEVIPKRVRVEPFSNHHMRTFLKGWPSHKERSALDLYALLQKHNQIRDICRNPLLLTILTGLFLENNQFSLPKSRNKFYEEAIDELMIQRPGRRGIHLLFSNEATRILEIISLRRLQVTSGEDPEAFSKEMLINIAKEHIDGDFKPNELIEELTKVNSIIKPAKQDWFTFNHRTIQEFLAAREAYRNMESKDAFETFSRSPQMRELLLFYCGLLQRVPEVNDLLQDILNQQDWDLAGAVLVNLTVVPNEPLITEISARLLEMITASTEDESGQLAVRLTNLASLAQRKGKAFEKSRRDFQKAIVFLGKKNNLNDVRTLANTLSANPTLAKGFLSGLLVHPDAKLRLTGMKFLKDMGTEEGLDTLVTYLGDHNTTEQQQNAAFILAELIPDQKEELISRQELFPPYGGKPWPYDQLLPTRIAVALKKATQANVTGCVAIDAIEMDDLDWKRVNKQLGIEKRTCWRALTFISLSGAFSLALFLITIHFLTIGDYTIARFNGPSPNFFLIKKTSLREMKEIFTVIGQNNKQNKKNALLASAGYLSYEYRRLNDEMKTGNIDLALMNEFNNKYLPIELQDWHYEHLGIQPSNENKLVILTPHLSTSLLLLLFALYALIFSVSCTTSTRDIFQRSEPPKHIVDEDIISLVSLPLALYFTVVITLGTILFPIGLILCYFIYVGQSLDIHYRHLEKLTSLPTRRSRSSLSKTARGDEKNR